MNTEQARFILRSYRASGADAADPAFAEALRAVEQDSALRAWFDREQAFDLTAVAKLREIAPPPDLRASILAGGRVSRPVSFWRRPLPWSIAAGLAMLLAIGVVTARLIRPASAETLPEFAVEFAGRGFIGLRERNPELAELTRWLAQRGAPLPAHVPPQLAGLHRLGCRTVEYQGHDISLICFEGEREFHLFVARRADFPHLEGTAEPRFQEKRGWASATWADDRLHYVLVSDAGLEAVKGLL